MSSQTQEEIFEKFANSGDMFQIFDQTQRVCYHCGLEGAFPNNKKFSCHSAVIARKRASALLKFVLDLGMLLTPIINPSVH